ncbi:hypothetical protein Q7P37_009955 [Cladosporium fusiforme]
MASSDFAESLWHQDPATIAQVMETLHDMQRELPGVFSDLRFKIGMKGEQDTARLKYFGSYAGPDPETLRTLEANYQVWAANPLLFWKNPSHTVLGTSAPGELVAIYINTKSDDA